MKRGSYGVGRQGRGSRDGGGRGRGDRISRGRGAGHGAEGHAAVGCESGGHGEGERSHAVGGSQSETFSLQVLIFFVCFLIFLCRCLFTGYSLHV